MSDRLRDLTLELMRIPGLSGHEDRVRARIAAELDALGLAHRTDVLGNLIVTLLGDGPAVMLIAHMDQVGLMVRRVEVDGLLRVERVGGVPVRTLLGQAVLICLSEGRDLPGVIGAKSHHATTAEERMEVPALADLTIDAGFASAEDAWAAGVEIGTPVVCQPQALQLAGGRIAGTAVDDRAACAVALEVARALADGAAHPTVHLVFSVQEEFNLRGALPAAQALRPDIALQFDLALAADTPEMAGSGEVHLGAGPALSLMSFHGRGTLNGLLPHPALVRLAEAAAGAESLGLQRALHMGVLTETSYVQLVGEGVACLDLGFPCRYAHAPVEVCDLSDLRGLAQLVLAMLARIGPDFELTR
ncbi:MAG: M20/M25/M40 family metallo-hydrolase [Pseudomonadota bacterium]